MRVSDGALLVVDAVAGVEVQTEKAWAAAQELNLPRMVVLSRLDRERASLERTLESLRQTCGREIVPIQLPIGEERDFNGVVDLVSMKALHVRDRRLRQDDRGRGSRRHDRSGERGARGARSRWSPRPTSS